MRHKLTMGIKMILVVLVVGLCSSICVNGERRQLKSRVKKVLQIQKQPMLLNKAPAKTLEYFGDLYDCVDFFEQPAFRNPLLKNHTYKYQMQSKFSRTDNEMHNSEGIIELPDGGCPTGTVPIRRTRNESSDPKQKNHISTDGGKTYRAVVRTNSLLHTKFYGGKTSMSVYSPKVSSTQYSSGIMTLGNGRESVEVGWMVNPLRYDNKSRVYVYTTTTSSSCYDLLCDNFVQTSSRYPLGLALSPVSRSGHGGFYQIFYVHNDQTTGTWRFAIRKNNEEIGFWPREVFTEFTKFATYVEWGGEVRTTSGQSGPQMGSGRFPKFDLHGDAFSLITTVDETRRFMDQVSTISLNDDERLYKAHDYGKTILFSHLVMFGGPGPKF